MNDEHLESPLVMFFGKFGVTDPVGQFVRTRDTGQDYTGRYNTMSGYHITRSGHFLSLYFTLLIIPVWRS